MQIKKLITDDSAVSPVIGVILMVAITVLLAATAASFFLGLTGQNSDTPQAAIQFDYSAATDGDGDQAHVLKIKHSGGDTLKAENVRITVNDVATPSAPRGYGVISSAQYTWNELDDGSQSEISAGMNAEVSRESFSATNYPDLGPNDGFSLKKASASVVWNDPDNDQTFTLAEWKSPTA